MFCRVNRCTQHEPFPFPTFLWYLSLLEMFIVSPFGDVGVFLFLFLPALHRGGKRRAPDLQDLLHRGVRGHSAVAYIGSCPLFGLFIFVLTRYIVWVEVLPLATGIAHSNTIWTGKWQVLQMPARRGPNGPESSIEPTRHEKCREESTPPGKSTTRCCSSW